MQILALVFIWVIIGIWMCWKRKWYHDVEFSEACCVVAVIFMPINFVVIFLKEFCINPWEN